MRKNNRERTTEQFDLFRSRREARNAPPNLRVVNKDENSEPYSGIERRSNNHENQKPILDRCKEIIMALNLELSNAGGYAIIWDAPITPEALYALRDTKEHDIDGNNFYTTRVREISTNDLAPEHITQNMIESMDTVPDFPGWLLVQINFTKNIVKGDTNKKWGLIKPDEVQTFFELTHGPK